MRLPCACDPFLKEIEQHFPELRPAPQRGLALWVGGTMLAGSACEAAVLLALRPVVGGAAPHALRQVLREWGRDGADKVAACRIEVDVAAYFAPLLGWVLAWWRGGALALALDATSRHIRLVVVSICVLYRGTAIPVAWHVAAADRPGAWLEPTLGLLARLAPAVPAELPVLLLADRGLGSGRLGDATRGLGWHPLRRIRPDATFRPAGGTRVQARSLVPGPGHAWVGAGTAFKHAPTRRDATLVVVWETGQTEPWVVLTDLAPEAVGPAWSGLRTWVERGCRALKRMGWHGERARQTHPQRVARPWLVLAVAPRFAVATGTREEDAACWGRDPDRLRVARPPARARRRVTALLTRGLVRLRWQLLRTRRLWTPLWLWPDPPPGLQIVIVPPPKPLHS